MRNRYTKGMTKKIDLNNLFNIIEEDPLILNIEDMNFDERTTLFDKLYQDYILLLDEKQSSKRVAANYRILFKEISSIENAIPSP